MGGNTTRLVFQVQILAEEEVEEDTKLAPQYSHCRPKDTMMSASPLEILLKISGVTLAQTCRAFSIDCSTSAWDMSGV